MTKFHDPLRLRDTLSALRVSSSSSTGPQRRSLSLVSRCGRPEPTWELLALQEANRILEKVFCKAPPRGRLDARLLRLHWQRRVFTAIEIGPLARTRQEISDGGSVRPWFVEALYCTPPRAMDCPRAVSSASRVPVSLRPAVGVPRAHAAFWWGACEMVRV